jgi:peroxiredoxin
VSKGVGGMKRAHIILALVLLLAWARAPLLAQKPIDFVLKDLEGNPVRLSDHLGKSVILIDFWATWCVPCVKELVHFQRFHEQYKDKGLLILALTVDGPESIALVRPFVKRYKYTFPVLFDTESKVIALYNPRVIMPYTVLIGRDGMIHGVHQGYSLGDEKVIEQEILRLLEPQEAAAAKAVGLNVTEAFLFRNFSDRDYAEAYREGRRSQIINQLEATLAAGNWLVGARWDENWDFTPWKDRYNRKGKLDDPETTILDYRPIILRKSFVEFAAKTFTLRAGDFYHTLGRGLSFSLLKTFEKEGLEYIIDTTVDGGKLSVTRGRFSLDAFGGWITRGDEALAEQRFVRDRVYGGTLGYHVGTIGDVKVNLMGASLEPGTLLGTKTAAMGSVVIDIPSFRDRARFYGEFLLSRKNRWYSEGDIDGHGVYLEGSVFVKNLTLLFEFKDYRNLDFEYNRPPLLESEQIPIVANQFVDSAENITGVSGRVDFNIPGAATLLFSKATYQTEKKHDLYGRDILHIFGGYEKKFKETGWLTLIAGYRNEASSTIVFWDTAGPTVHAQGNLSYPLSKRVSFEVDLEAKKFSGDLSFGGKYFKYDEVRSYYSIAYSPHWVLTFLCDYTADPKILTFNHKHYWPGVQFEVRFGQANSVRIFYGSIKGGVKCAGGICKFFPPFEGLRVDCFLRF